MDFAEIRVPDIAKVIAAVQNGTLDLDDVLYESAGPISAHDVMYAGFQSKLSAADRISMHTKRVLLTSR
ncbi:hypothetical protein [Candidatus Aalborgicola defluviihabitans]|uniref:hypothetical protein n=1 Tax=Candidatus Aalborgicola defluviihabitans TaxID=3386187 RepID=UPI0039B9153F